jgi:hypothetical protein
MLARCGQEQQVASANAAFTELTACRERHHRVTCDPLPRCPHINRQPSTIQYPHMSIESIFLLTSSLAMDSEVAPLRFPFLMTYHCKKFQP